MKSSKILYIILLLGFSFMMCNAKEAKDFTVVIDPGHGGKDAGAVESIYTEKDINLNVALKLGEMLKKKLGNVNVVFTRHNDTFVSLQGRADIANKAKGDLFISIHTNSLDKNNKNRETASGSSVYVLGLHKDNNNLDVARRENSVIKLEKGYEQNYGFDPNSDESYIIFEMAQKKNLSQSIKFANEVQKQLVGTAGRRDRGVHQAGFWVLWATSMPSVLVELDFICNKNSVLYLNSEEGQKKLAESIFNAVKSYYESYSANKKKNRTAENIEVQKPENGETLLAKVESNRAERRLATESSSIRKNTSPAGRKRRSASSKSISEKTNYESADLVVNSGDVKENSSIKIIEEQLAMDNPQEEKAVSEKKTSTNVRKERKSGGRHKAKIDKYKLIYAIQLFESEKHLSSNDAVFHGLKPIKVFKDKDKYKYFYSESENKSEVDRQLQMVKEIIPEAFIIQNYKRVSSNS